MLQGEKSGTVEGGVSLAAWFRMGFSSPSKQDAAVHDEGSDDGHSVAFVLDAILSHVGVTDSHVPALMKH